MNSGRNIMVERTAALPMDEQPLELVERKGIGHPDTICDSIMEAVCHGLCREYMTSFGHICHHNIDKGLLVAGRSLPKPGGGILLEPMKIIFGDRAAYSCSGRTIPVGEIAVDSARTWIRENLRLVDPDRDVIYQNEIKPGSPELTDAFERNVIGANDTSVGVGYAPLSRTERIVLLTEQYLNGPTMKERFPEVGEDVKIMGCRCGHRLSLTIAAAFVDRLVHGAGMYFDRKRELQGELHRFAMSMAEGLEEITVEINTLDDPSRGDGGMYLTVLGTSAEGGDGGQVGRGNRVNGLIPFNRPQSTEAAAGKNPVNHVGKIYSILSHEIANRIVRDARGVREAVVFLCSQIGKPVDRPLLATAQVAIEPDADFTVLRREVSAIIDNELDAIGAFTGRLIAGRYRVC